MGGGGLELGWKQRRAVLGGLMAAVIGALMVCAWIQTAVLEKQRNLVDPHARLHHRQLRGPLQPRRTLLTKKEGWTKRSPITKRHCKSSPTTRKPTTTSASALLQKGRVDEAIAHYQKALQIKPDYAEAHYNLGIALQQKGRMDEAITHYQKALEIKPDYAKAPE